MGAQRRSLPLLVQALAAVKQYGSVKGAARELGVPYPTFQSRHDAAQLAVAHGDIGNGTDYTVAPLPDSGVSAATLLAQRRTAYRKKHKAAEARKLIPITVKLDGPVGIAHFGDPHVDDDGTNIELLESHVAIIKRTKGLLAGNVGDYRNNWIGRLARLWAQQSTSAKDALTLTRWLLGSIPWLYLVGGNHDAWSGEDDPIPWIAQQLNALYEPHAARLELKFPNGRKIRINARHDFKGHSEWNTAHGAAKAARIGWRDHILTCGHTHVSGYQVVKDPSSGIITHVLRVASYKFHDRFAVERGLPDQNIFACPVTIIDPSKADDDPRLITTIFTPDVGADFLTFLRRKK